MLVPKRRYTKKWEQYNHEWHKALHEYMVSIASDIPGNSWHTYYVQTIFGRLGVTFIDDWIACRFDEPNKYDKSIGGVYPVLNPFTGKWNFHTETAQDSFEWFKMCLDKILVNPAP